MHICTISYLDFLALHLYFLIFVSFYFYDTCQHSHQLSLWTEQFLREGNFTVPVFSAGLFTCLSCWRFHLFQLVATSDWELWLIKGWVPRTCYRCYGFKKYMGTVFHGAADDKLSVRRSWISAWCDSLLFLFFVLMTLYLTISALHMNDIRILSWENKVCDAYESADGTTCPWSCVTAD